METLFFILCSGFFTAIWSKLEQLDTKIDSLEVDVVAIKQSTPKRKDDHVDFTLN
jgi:hypothetical protein